MDKELKPCPFCGNTDITVMLNRNHVGIVGCHICGGQVRQFGSQEQATIIWNRRADNEKNMV